MAGRYGPMPPSLAKADQPPQLYAGKVTCLKCRKPFKSWDRRKNKICPACSSSNRHIVDDGTSF